MNADLIHFESIWKRYSIFLPINDYEFAVYTRIIDRIQSNKFMFTSNEKTNFLAMLEVLLLTIYNYKQVDTNKELACCYRIKKHLLE